MLKLSREGSRERIFIGIGMRRNSVYEVSELMECPNIHEEPMIRFRADPLCIYNAYVEAESKGMNIVLLVHSHPASSNPSLEDLRGMSLWPVPWLIINSITMEYCAWILINGECLKMHVEVI